MRGGKSVATSMGMSPQSGIPHNNRAGDFDPFAIPVIMQHTGQTLEQVLGDLAERSGLLGLSGVSGDVRDLEEAAANGNERAQLALDVFVSDIRHSLGAMLVELGGADCIVFTGGIGENGTHIRQRRNRRTRRAGHRARRECQRHGPGRSQNQRARQPHANLGRAHQRRNHRGPPNQTTVGSPRLNLMFLAKVTGSLVSTQKVDSMVGHKLLLVEPYRVDPQDRSRLASTGRTFVAVDSVGAGEGEFVLITQGSSARLTPETKNLPIDAVIVGLVDTVHVEQQRVFSRQHSED